MRCATACGSGRPPPSSWLLPREELPRVAARLNMLGNAVGPLQAALAGKLLRMQLRRPFVDRRRPPHGGERKLEEPGSVARRRSDATLRRSDATQRNAAARKELQKTCLNAPSRRLPPSPAPIREPWLHPSTRRRRATSMQEYLLGAQPPPGLAGHYIHRHELRAIAADAAEKGSRTPGLSAPPPPGIAPVAGRCSR